MEQRLQVNLYPYIFKPAREHYGIIKNDLAIQCNRNKEKIHIRDDLEGEWLWIDDSYGLGELENKSPLRNMQVQRWWNDNKKHDFKVTPSFLLENINKLVQSQLIEQENKAEYSRDLVKHKEAIKTMGNNTEANTKSIELLADILLELKETIKK